MPLQYSVQWYRTVQLYDYYRLYTCTYIRYITCPSHRIAPRGLTDLDLGQGLMRRAVWQSAVVRVTVQSRCGPSHQIPSNSRASPGSLELPRQTSVKVWGVPGPLLPPSAFTAAYRMGMLTLTRRVHEYGRCVHDDRRQSTNDFALQR